MSISYRFTSSTSVVGCKVFISKRLSKYDFVFVKNYYRHLWLAIVFFLLFGSVIDPFLMIGVIFTIFYLLLRFLC